MKLFKNFLIKEIVLTYEQQKQGELDRQIDYILSNRADLKNVFDFIK